MKYYIKNTLNAVGMICAFNIGGNALHLANLHDDVVRADNDLKKLERIAENHLSNSHLPIIEGEENNPCDMNNYFKTEINKARKNAENNKLEYQFFKDNKVIPQSLFYGYFKD